MVVWEKEINKNKQGGDKYYWGVPKEYPPLPKNIKLGHFYLNLGQNYLVDELNKPINEQKQIKSHQKMLSIEVNHLIVEHFLPVDEVFYLDGEMKMLEDECIEGDEVKSDFPTQSKLIKNL